MDRMTKLQAIRKRLEEIQRRRERTEGALEQFKANLRRMYQTDSTKKIARMKEEAKKEEQENIGLYDKKNERFWITWKESLEEL